MRIPLASVRDQFHSNSDLLAAAPGGFFDPRTGGPIGPLYVGTKCIRPNYNGRAAGTLVVLTEEGIEFHARDYQATIRQGVDVAFWSGPKLVCGGEIVVDAQGEGYREKRLLGEADRAALGQDDKGRLLLFIVRGWISLPELAEVAKRFGCVQAVNLDGSGSAFFAYRDETGKAFFFNGDPRLPYIIGFKARR